jgi:hypothetical protein
MERDNLTHGARSALNHSPEIRQWCEDFLKQKHREINSQMTNEEYEKYWRYHKPEIMHEGATEAIQAYKTREK